MKDIYLKSLIGDNCVSYEDASILYNTILPLLKEKEQVNLIFIDVSIISSPFFNGSIGKLLKDFTRSELKELIHIKELPAYAKNTLKIVLDNSESFYKNKEHHNDLDKILLKD